MRSIADLLPKVDDLLSLEDAELGLVILRLLNEGSGRTVSLHEITHPLWQSTPYKYPRERARVIEDALAEAWSWLRAQNFLIPDPTQSSTSSFYFVSRRGRKVRTEADAETYRRVSKFPKELFHPRIYENTWSLLLRGKYGTAVFEAFLEVEVAVRDACSYPADNEHVGVKLMRKAFAPNKGLLTDQTAEGGEQQGLCDLFAGAMGSYKNPHSHRHVGILTVEEATEMVMLASHLLRIVEDRARRLKPDGI
jgi:uncharacterized protein (TIGR02391 family)